MNCPRPLPLCHTILPIGLSRIFALASLVLGLAFRQSALAWLGLLALVTVSGTRIWAAAGGSGLDLRVDLDPARAFPGETVRLGLALNNRSILPIRAKVSATLPREIASESGLRSSLIDCTVPSLGNVSRHIVLKPQKRGVYEFGRIGVETGDPFGFFLCTTETDRGKELIVYPRIFALDTKAFPALGFFGASFAKSLAEDPAYSAGTRDHAENRPARFIHWKASAHRGRLQEKIFEPTARRDVCLIVDAEGFESKGAAEEFEGALEIAASMAFVFGTGDAALGFISNAGSKGGGAQFLRSGKGGEGPGRILEAMARLEMRATCDIAEIVGRGMRAQRFSTAVYFGRELGAGALCVRSALSRVPGLHLSFVLTELSDAPGGIEGCTVFRPADLCPTESGDD